MTNSVDLYTRSVMISSCEMYLLAQLLIYLRDVRSIRYSSLYIDSGPRSHIVGLQIKILELPFSSYSICDDLFF